MTSPFKFMVALFIALALTPMPGVAGESAVLDAYAARKKSLEESSKLLDQARHNHEIHLAERKKQLADLRIEDVDRNLLEQSRLDFEAARMGVENADVDVQTLSSTIRGEESVIAQLQHQIQSLKSATGQDADAAQKEQLPNLEVELADKEKLLSLNRQRLDVLQKLHGIAEQNNLLAAEWMETLQGHFSTSQRKTQQEALEQVRGRLQTKIKEQQDKITEWRSEINILADKPDETSGKRPLLEWRIYLAEERIRFHQMEIRVAELENQRGHYNTLPTEQTATAEIETYLEWVTAFHSDTNAALDLLRRKDNVLRQLLSVTEKRPTPEWLKSLQIKDIEGLAQSYAGLGTVIDGLRKATKTEQNTIRRMLNDRIRTDLQTRQLLPSTIEEWQFLGSALLLLPEELLKKSAMAFQNLGRTIQEAPIFVLLLLLSFEAAWLAFSFWFRIEVLRKAVPGQGAAAQISFGKASAIRIGLMIWKNFWILLPAGGLVIAVSAVGMAPPDSTVLYTLALLPPAIGLGLQALRFFLIEFNPDAGAAQIHRFRLVAVIIILGSIYSGMVIVTHAMTFPQPLQDLLDRVFMIFLFLGILPIFGFRQGAIAGLSERLGEGYWMQVIRFLSLIVPLSFLVAAAIGLAGYVNLGWVAGKYISWLILVLVTWAILHGLWDDFDIYLKNRVNLKVKDSLFWIQGVIDPVHRVGRLLLFAGAWFGLFFIYGWDSQSKPAQMLIKTWSWVLFYWGKTPIQLSDLVLLLVLVSVFIWWCRWVRQMTFRMMFRKIADIGIRHSLSVFAQYGVVLLGFLFTLRYMGIDLTNLAIVAGALGVGIGFGLQNVANNFVSGLLLLLERPIRTGDIIKVADKIGEVTKIGVRAVTIKTPDNHEVIIL